ncbi:MAG: hypothetical protein N3E51_01105 [Candidatus Micrarchaeota archaeon]|nr:hypothetical protein [Candidatus Micrarchaeota archaeon]
MDFPSSAIFAFNANLDHIKHCAEEDLKKMEQLSPVLASQMEEAFSWGVQKEVTISLKDCELLLSNFSFEKTVVGGQAGNAAQQASALGVKCFLHTNFANQQLAQGFAHPDRIMLACEEGFVTASSFSSSAPTAHHFVFEHAESRTRFIASYDPLPIHPDSRFCEAIRREIHGISKAFVGGFHLLGSPEQLRKFTEELSCWKRQNPSLRIFCEMGQFQSRQVLKAAERELFPLVDFVGLNEVEAGMLSAEPHELASERLTVLLHSPREQEVFPHWRKSAAALEFARRCAAFKAKTGKFASEKELVGAEAAFVERPVETVGLGDTFSCAYFMLA